MMSTMMPLQYNINNLILITILHFLYLLSTSTATNYTCFNATDGGFNGVLYTAVRDYIDQDCVNNEECTISQTYGHPINSWCVGNVTDLSYLFEMMDTFNEDINGWNTSSVIKMSWLFDGASSFNGDLSKWNTGKVTSISGIFEDATSFTNGGISNWDVSSVSDMSGAFKGATNFNADLNSWNTTSSLNNLFWTFEGATSFNSDLSNWDVSNVTDMYGFLYNAASYNQNLCAWRDDFPYKHADDVFTYSACNITTKPQEDKKGPFCASDCGPEVSYSKVSLHDVAYCDDKVLKDCV